LGNFRLNRRAAAAIREEKIIPEARCSPQATAATPEGTGKRAARFTRGTKEAAVAILSGVIIVAQENRFQLALDEGGTRIFVLAHNAGIDPDQLSSLRRAQARVAVTFRPAEGLIADQACTISETTC
jgi:hypothetical protein